MEAQKSETPCFLCRSLYLLSTIVLNDIFRLLSYQEGALKIMHVHVVMYMHKYFSTC